MQHVEGEQGKGQQRKGAEKIEEAAATDIVPDREFVLLESLENLRGAYIRVGGSRGRGLSRHRWRGRRECGGRRDLRENGFPSFPGDLAVEPRNLLFGESALALEIVEAVGHGMESAEKVRMGKCEVVADCHIGDGGGMETDAP